MPDSSPPSDGGGRGDHARRCLCGHIEAVPFTTSIFAVLENGVCAYSSLSNTANYGGGMVGGGPLAGMLAPRRARPLPAGTVKALAAAMAERSTALESIVFCLDVGLQAVYPLRMLEMEDDLMDA